MKPRTGNARLLSDSTGILHLARISSDAKEFSAMIFDNAPDGTDNLRAVKEFARKSRADGFHGFVLSSNPPLCVIKNEPTEFIYVALVKDPAKPAMYAVAVPMSEACCAHAKAQTTAGRRFGEAAANLVGAALFAAGFLEDVSGAVGGAA